MRIANYLKVMLYFLLQKQKENSGLEDPLFFLAHKYTTTIGLSSNTDDKENVDRGK